MDKLIYTDRKTSGKKIKFNIGKKKIEFDPKSLLLLIKPVITGIVMGAGMFMVLVSTFGLEYNPSQPFSGGFRGSLAETWNRIAYMLADRCGIFADQFTGSSGTCNMFLTFVLLVLVAVSLLIVFSKNKWLAFAYPVIAAIPLIIWGLSGTVMSYAVLALGIAAFLADGINRKNNYGALIYAAAVVVAAFLIISIPAVSHLADKPESLKAYTEKTQQSIADDHFGTNILKNGNLRVNKREKRSGEALSVEMEKPHSMYLRGFVGDILEDDGWVTLSNSLYYENRNLVYWLDQYDFNGLGQLQQSADFANKGGKKELNELYQQDIGKVTVHNTNADSRYAYVPYEITGDKLSAADGGTLDCQNWGDSFITGGWREKLEDYSYESAENLTSTWTDTAAKYYSNNETDPNQSQYELSESHYNSNVYTNYLYISSEDRQILDSTIGNSGVQKRGHVEYNTAVTNVKNIMSSLFIYTEKIKYDKDFSVFQNIMTTYQGYDAQYATAAVMLFRYYGIPARYVEGYLVTDEDIYSQGASAGSAISVKAKRNHAWAEIYVDKIGFVPVETCPQYMGLMQEADYTIGITNKTSQATEDLTPMNDENPNDAAPSTGKVTDKKVPSKILIIIGIVIGLIILAAIVLGIVFLIKKIKKILRRRKLFLKGDPKEASCAIYKRMEELELKPDKEAMDIGNRAAYSIYPVTDKDRQTMLKKLKKFKKDKREEKKRQRRKKK